MIVKRIVIVTTFGLLFLLMVPPQDTLAQCSGRGGGGGMPSGSTSTLNTSIPYTSNGLVSGYPQSPLMMAAMYQQQALQVQNQALAMAYQNAERQRLAMAARRAQALPGRLARAEATRAARAERIARLSERNKDSSSESSDRYTFTSIKSSQ